MQPVGDLPEGIVVPPPVIGNDTQGKHATLKVISLLDQRHRIYILWSENFEMLDALTFFLEIIINQQMKKLVCQPQVLFGPLINAIILPNR